MYQNKCILFNTGMSEYELVFNMTNVYNTSSFVFNTFIMKLLADTYVIVLYCEYLSLVLNLMFIMDVC